MCFQWHCSVEQNWYALQNSKLQVIAEFTETCPLAAWCPAILSFQTGMNATLLNYVFLGVYELLQSLQWHSSVGCHSQSFSSDIPVWGSFSYIFHWCSSVGWMVNYGRLYNLWMLMFGTGWWISPTTPTYHISQNSLQTEVQLISTSFNENEQRRRCYTYIWVINIFIAYRGASYVKVICLAILTQHTDILKNWVNHMAGNFTCRTHFNWFLENIFATIALYWLNIWIAS